MSLGQKERGRRGGGERERDRETQREGCRETEARRQRQMGETEREGQTHRDRVRQSERAPVLTLSISQARSVDRSCYTESEVKFE